MELKRIIAVLSIAVLVWGVCFISYMSQQKEKKAESAAAPVDSAATYDVSTLPAHSETKNTIRMDYAQYYGEDIIQTSDGNLWEMNTEEIDPYQLLLIWFDTKNTPEIEDDSIIDVWRQVYN